MSCRFATPLDKLHPIPEVAALWEGMTTPEEDAALLASVLKTGAVRPIVADETGGIIVLLYPSSSLN
jgi:hypothetical protein